MRFFLLKILMVYSCLHAKNQVKILKRTKVKKLFINELQFLKFICIVNILKTTSYLTFKALT